MNPASVSPQGSIFFSRQTPKTSKCTANSPSFVNATNSSKFDRERWNSVDFVHVMAEPVAPPSSTPAASQEISRRSFLKLGWGALLGFAASSAGATLRFIFPNVLYEPPQTFNAGKPVEYPVGVSTRWIKEQRVWIIRNETGIYALWARCTHLGCTPNWFQ